MDFMFLGIVIFLFVLAAFDLYVGVSNDAVNFLNSAIGSKAARFKTLVIIASVGVFAGCVLSNGMMDIARHGIFTPEYFSFREVMLIFMAVMVTDIVLLDVFNTFGMPTSTTVSMVFELLGASFAFVVIKNAVGAMPGLGFDDYLNTSKALEVIMGIFLSVPIAFVVGSIVQYITRIIFTFNIKSRLTWKIGLFGGVALTAIIYFMLFKGLKDLSFMSKDVKAYIADHIGLLLGCCLVVTTVLMQLLHALRVNVFKVIVLCGTFALATAFAGNDLVNFIGVPLAGFSSFQDFSVNAGGAAPSDFMMNSLADSAHTPFYFLVAAGAIMVFALATSKKARRVVETEVGLSRSDEGEEMFGSSRAARSLVRWGNAVGRTVVKYTPSALAQFIDRRFKRPAEADEDGAAYDLLRASVNLVTASLLIALGTSLKLPLSTTFVTFMVAMGSSLADRAWSRESAVFRITGVLTVVGGWFLTAGVAFTACFLVATLMNFGGMPAIIILVVLAVYAIIHSQRRYAKKQKEEKNGDLLFTEMLTTHDRSAIVPMLSRHLDVSTSEALRSYALALRETIDGLKAENLRGLRRNGRLLERMGREMKNLRRRETICLRRTDGIKAVALMTPFHLTHNALRQQLYGLRRINEPALEHVDNHFTPIPSASLESFAHLAASLSSLMEETAEALRHQRFDDIDSLMDKAEMLKSQIKGRRSDVLTAIQSQRSNLNAQTLLLHLIQETEQLCVEFRLTLKGLQRFHQTGLMNY